MRPPDSLRKAALALLLLSALAPVVRAEVFSLWPFSGGSSGRASQAEDCLNPKKLWSEPVIINGKELSLGVSLIDMPMESCLFQLRAAFPKASFARNSKSSLMELRLENGLRKRLFLVELDGIFPVVQFSMELPDKMPSRFEWPQALPLPPSSTPVTLMQFPKRSSVYGVFSSALSPEQALSEVSKTLLAGGWKAAGKESGSPFAGSGDIFLREDPMEIAIVGISNAGDGSATKGTIYTKPLK